MPSLPVLKQMFFELTSKKDAYRIPEPRLVMDDPKQVAAFGEAGLEGGVMAPVYLFHCAQVCEIIRPGNVVLDLGCGPANQLAMIARLNPETRFIGLDVSGEMLERAGQTVQSQGLHNVSLRYGDITRLEGFPDASVDAIYTTMVLHHLADARQLEETFRQLDRVLKPEGGIYLVDFGHLRTERAIRYFAQQYADQQPALFTVDYHNSLRAAFELTDWRHTYGRFLAHRAQLKATFAVPFMVAIKSPARRCLPADLQQELSRLYKRLPGHHQTDFRDLVTFFSFGGLRTPAFG